MLNVSCTSLLCNNLFQKSNALLSNKFKKKGCIEFFTGYYQTTLDHKQQDLCIYFLYHLSLLLQEILLPVV